MKKAIYVLPLFLLLLAGCGSKAVKDSVQDKGQPIQGKAAASGDAPAKAKHSLNSLLAAKQPVECDYQEDNQGAKTKMKFYLDASSRKMRGEGEMYDSREGKPVKASWLMLGHDYYSWGEAFGGKGFKMTINDKEKAEGDASGKKVDMDSEHEMDCRAWKVDNSKFSLPEDVSFSEIQQPATPSTTAPSAASLGAGASGPSSLCSSCGLISDASAKKACLENLKCK